jgi:hypothetical protein
VTDDAVSEALAVLEQRPDGHLPLPVRRRARLSLGDGKAGHARRLALARACAEAVLPRWRAERPDDRRPDEMIALAERVYAGEADPERALVDAVAVADGVTGLIEDGASEAAVNAAMAAVRLVVAARWDDDAERAAEPYDDERRDSYEWETAFYASMVDAPSLPKMEIAEHVEPRRRFWRWYLEEALPAARGSH